MKILTLLVFFPLVCFAQKQNKLSFELGIGKNNFSMHDLNQFYVDSFAVKNEMLDKGISIGNQFFLGIKYRPKNSLFDIGFYGNYQNGKTAGRPKQIITDDLGNQIGMKEIDFILKTEAIGLGISNCWYISHLLKFQEKENKILNRFHIGLELNAGIGFSRASLDFRDTELVGGSTYNYFISRDFQSQVGLKFEYDYLKSPIISSIGLKVGYQYFNTQTLKDRNGENWFVQGNTPINLNFSGVFGLLYLVIGK